MVQLNPVGSLISPSVAAHIADTSIHFADAPADAQDYVRNNNAWVVASAGGVPGGANGDIQFNNSGVFGGFGDWDGSTLEIEASQAAIILDESDGGGSAFLRLTSSSTGDSGIQIEFDSSSGTDARIRQVTPGGSLEDIWIAFVENGLVGLYHNGIQTTRTATLAAGGLEVNNTVTGGGFERVLTTSDISAGVTTLAGLSDTNIVAPASLQLLAYTGAAWENVAIDVSFQNNWDHDNLQNVGTNAHATIDSHIADASIHFTAASLSIGDLGNVTETGPANGDILVYSGGQWVNDQLENQVISHFDLDDIGTNDHDAIDTHIADATVHFTEASIDHTNIGSIGTNSHAAIDTHIADGTIHFTEGSIDHGSIAGLADDDHTQYLLLAGRTGQTIEDSIVINDAFSNSGVTSSITIADTFTTGAGYLGGGILSNGTVTYDNSFFIWALLQESKTYRAAAGPGFAAFTLFNALAAIENAGNFDLVQALILNNGLTHRRVTSGTSVTAQTIGLSNSPHTRAQVSGAVMTKTVGDIAVQHAPKFSTVAGSTVNLGTQIGLNLIEPAVALFQTQAGTENMTAYYGVNFANMTFGGASATYSVIRSLLNSGTNKRFLDHTGTAVSRMRGQLLFDVDLTGITFGASSDFQLGYAAGDFFFMQQNTGDTGQLRISSELQSATTQRWLFTASERPEFNFDCDRFSMGAQTGAVGNQVGVFVAPTRSVSVGGEWSDFLLTQAGNITVNAAMGLIAGWTINAPSITLGTGSVTTAAGLNIGGNPTNATNRVGLRIISNPSGGGGVNAALWITAGRSRFDGIVDINNGIALGGGAAATLGTIGGSGPTTAAQAQWVQIEIGGVVHWIPAWT